MKYNKLSIACMCPFIFLSILLTVNSNSNLLFKTNHLEKQTTEKISPYAVNKNGQTYGKQIYDSDEEPDLIAVYGIDGTFGYIKSTDLDSNVNTPEEAIEQEKNRKTCEEIPVYDKDGEKVISKFKINTEVDN